MATPESKVLDHKQISEILPHRPPLLLVDRVLDFVVGESLHGYKCVSSLDPYFAGHFPGEPILPGVYIVEGLAQAAGILCIKTLESQGKGLMTKTLLTTIDSAKFRKPVTPGDVLHYHVKFEKCKGPFTWVSGVAKVDDVIVAEASFSAVMAS